MRWSASVSDAPRSAFAGDLNLEAFETEGGQVIEGLLRDATGLWFPVTRGVPCFLQGVLRPDLGEFCKRYGLAEPARAEGANPQRLEQQRTNVTFSDKWGRFRNYGMDEDHRAFLFGWYCRKLGVGDIDGLRAFYRSKRTILEVGPGSGFNTRFMAQNTAGQVYALDISEAAYTTFANTRDLPNCHVVQADLMDAPFAEAQFDFVIADGVLHHTPDTRAAARALYRLVRPGGSFFFYVYRKMGPSRQFCDEYIRSHFTKLAAEECYRACEGLTELGRELSRLNAKIYLDKGVPILGIPPGLHDVQRLVYYNFVKCFWNDAFDFPTNNMVNFDWYHPLSAWQHTEEEVRTWLEELGVTDYRFNQANPNGISVLLTRPS
ncbi:MAG: class I SAM-dependent methyltransferase [Burkholderiales bacterium]|nr:class I SAM-dependent methyltransferase [Burkholderiales bacterium]